MSASVITFKKRKALKAPHPDLQDALFLYATGGDGVNAIQIRGWTDLVAKVEEEVAGEEWAETLSDLDEWQDNGWGVPTLYTVDLGGDWVSIYRVTEATEGPAP